MARDVVIEVEGVEELEEKFEKLVESTSEKELVEAVEPAAEVVREDSARLAPRRTGRLAENIIKQIQIEEELNVIFGVSYDQEEVPYGMFQEVGWTDRGGNFHIGNPYLRPAFDRNRDRVVGVIGKNIRKRIMQEAEA